MNYRIIRFSETDDNSSPIQNAKKESKVGAGLTAAGLGAWVGGDLLKDAGHNQYLKSDAGKQAKSILEKFKNSGNVPKDKMLEIGTNMKNAVKGIGEKNAIQGARKIVGGSLMKKAGIGLAVAGGAKMIYDHFKNKKNSPA